MRLKEFILNILGIILTILLFIGCFTATYYLTSYVYDKIGETPSDFVIQVVNSLLSVTLVFIIVKIAMKFEEHKSGLFDSIIRAQKKISEGNYNIDLNKNIDGMGPFSELVESVNNMAFELSKLEKMRQEFISNVSHEIQSPLTSIRGFSQALRNNHLSSEDRLHYLNIIEAESIRLSKLSDNLLRLASLETDTMKFEPDTYRVDGQIRQSVLLCEPQWTEKHINIELYLEEIEMKADEEMLSQVWINLINNSIKFTPENGSITINLKKKGNLIEFQISDSGVGIAQDDLNRIFERFYKADKSRRPSILGSGLGLSIVKKIVDIHQGDIHVESILGKGTLITLSLPC